MPRQKAASVGSLDEACLLEISELRQMWRGGNDGSSLMTVGMVLMWMGICFFVGMAVGGAVMLGQTDRKVRTSPEKETHETA